MEKHVDTLAQLIRDGGSVLIAAAVIAALIYLGWRFVIRPGMALQAETAKAQEETARQHAIITQELKCAVKSCQMANEANARTAANLERLAEIMLTQQTSR